MWTKQQYEAHKAEAYRRGKEWLQRPWWFQQEEAIPRFTGWLVFYTFVLAVVSSLQFCELQQADQTTRDALTSVQRAFVFQKDDAIRAITTANEITWHLYPTWENSGNTPTKNLLIRVLCKPSLQKLDKPFDFIAEERTAETAPRLLGPHQTTVGGTCERSSAELVALQKQGGLFYMGGIATYSDVFEIPHRTRFCHAWAFYSDMSVASPPPQTTSVLCASGNCADKECDEQDRQK